MPEVRPCKLCGVPIMFLQTASGHWMPLNVRLEELWQLEPRSGKIVKYTGHRAHWADCQDGAVLRRARPR